MKTLEQKLLEAQKRIGTIKRDSTNPYFKSKYFDINAILAEVKPILNECGLVLLQGLTTDLNCKPALQTVILDSESGKQITYTIGIPELSDPQKMGSAITYFRRYALQSLLALEAEDDDANMASNKSKKVEKELDTTEEVPF